MNRRTMNVIETAEYLGVCKDTIYTMVRSDEIPHFRLRRRIFFSEKAISKWIEEQESSYKHQAI
ncbi:helix-turn-helix domain-containing protein [Halobacillus mangrovi]|uniref:helix-turn-helix domain-containing protein n=1 Tax=Halobacillus mangrovi TaxID=402384 RepID=UPI003D995DDF